MMIVYDAGHGVTVIDDTVNYPDRYLVCINGSRYRTALGLREAVYFSRKTARNRRMYTCDGAKYWHRCRRMLAERDGYLSRGEHCNPLPSYDMMNPVHYSAIMSVVTGQRGRW